MFDELILSRARFTLVATQPVTLSEFSGSTLRGAFGIMLRKITCAQRYVENCQACYLQNNCAYAVIFNPVNRPDSKFFPGNNELPRSFIFYIEGNRTAFAAGEEINLVLTLVGKTTDYFPYFMVVLQELGREGFGLKSEKGRRGSFVIKTITDELAPAFAAKIIYNGPAKSALSPLHREKLKNLLHPVDGISRLKVRFITPLRVRWQGKLCSDIQFHILFRNALRRFSALYFLSANKPLELDYRAFIKQAEEIETLQADLQWHEYARYSSRQKEKMKLGGVTGWALYGGPLTPFYPFLQAGELMAVGKGTTFGFGRIMLEANPPEG